MKFNTSYPVLLTLLLSANLLGGCSEEPETKTSIAEPKSQQLTLPTPIEQAEAAPLKDDVDIAHLAIKKPEAVEKTATAGDPPNFSDFPAGSQRKDAFFDYMVPLIQQANQRILSKRQQAQTLFAKSKTQSLSQQDMAWLNQLADQYDVAPFDIKNPKDQAALLSRVDQIPVSLAVAQAANESAWGTSRFAKKANNYYGQWCFTKGCGLVPAKRSAGATHEVRAFKHPKDSVKSYLHNLNTHRTYAKLREIRATQRKQNQSLSGDKMAQGLVNYSQRKQAYVKELQSMIRYNKLNRFNLSS